MTDLIVLTEEQKQKYLKHSVKCPLCNSPDIYSSAAILDGENFQEIRCSECGARWNDIYALVDVELTGNPIKGIPMTLKLGDQIVYTPRHLRGVDMSFGYPFVSQPGFVVSSNSSGDYFCRYWIVENGKPINELRTKANSELTPADCIREMKTVPQQWVDDAIQVLMDGSGEDG